MGATRSVCRIRNEISAVSGGPPGGPGSEPWVSSALDGVVQKLRRARLKMAASLDFGSAPWHDTCEAGVVANAAREGDRERGRMRTLANKSTSPSLLRCPALRPPAAHRCGADLVVSFPAHRPSQQLASGLCALSPSTPRRSGFSARQATFRRRLAEAPVPWPRDRQAAAGRRRLPGPRLHLARRAIRRHVQPTKALNITLCRLRSRVSVHPVSETAQVPRLGPLRKRCADR